jgi:hypothetical protein
MVQSPAGCESPSRHILSSGAPLRHASSRISELTSFASGSSKANNSQLLRCINLDVGAPIAEFVKQVLQGTLANFQGSIVTLDHGKRIAQPRPHLACETRARTIANDSSGRLAKVNRLT